MDIGTEDYLICISPQERQKKKEKRNGDFVVSSNLQKNRSCFIIKTMTAKEIFVSKITQFNGF